MGYSALYLIEISSRRTMLLDTLPELLMDRPLSQELSDIEKHVYSGLKCLLV